jgi:hypothetical protein
MVYYCEEVVSARLGLEYGLCCWPEMKELAPGFSRSGEKQYLLPGWVEAGERLRAGLHNSWLVFLLS